MVNNKGRITSVSFALMLIISTFAFAYMIGSETKTVNADEDMTISSPPTIINLNGLSVKEKFSTYTELSNGYIVANDGTVYKGNFEYGGKNSIGIANPAELDSLQGLNVGGIIPPVSASVPQPITPDPLATPKLTLDELSSAYTDGNGNFYSDKEGKIPLYGPAVDASRKATATPTPVQTSKDVKPDATKSLTSKTGSFTTIAPNSLDAGKKLVGDSYDPTKEYHVYSSGAIYSVGTDGKTETWAGRGEQKTMAFGSWDYGTAQIIDGFSWAVTAAGIVMTLGQLFTKDTASLQAAAGGIAAGIMVGKLSMAVLGKGGSNLFGTLDNGITTQTTTNAAGEQVKSLDWAGRNAGIISAGVGLATAWLVYNAMWSNEKVTTETVTFNCLPWEAPHGGADCQLCNDATLPCSEYRCKSLGQSCEVVNKGTKTEMCVNVNPRDASPPVIKPNEADLSSGFAYFDIVEMPPGAGFKIKSTGTSTGCLPAYTPVQFGITTNEPSQCKIDIEPKGNYSKMATYLNGDNLYKYNHTEFLNLPSSADIKNSSITLKNGKELTFYIRCIDAAGNSNEADYGLTMCVDPSPDNTAPVIQGTSIENKGCVPADAENATVEFYVNEPSECRWDYYDKSYDQMKNYMSCSTSAVEINAIQSYTCATKLNGIARDGTNFFVRCKDQPEGIVNESKRNAMQESYVFNLRGSNQLKLKVLHPNETVYGAIRPTPVELYAETLFGCEDNKAVCYYSTSSTANSFVQFFDTDKTDGVHTQRLDLNDGTYTYFVRCVDAGGNVVNASTTFKVSIDVNAPVVARAYEEDGYLKLVTPLNSECVYNSNSCDYLFSEGIQMPYANSTTHVTEWIADKKYFIKCRDEYRSEPVDCSLIVRPTENFLGV